MGDMMEKPTPRHEWLHRLVGEWQAETECVMGPDQPPMKHKSSEVVKSMGGLWVLCEGSMAGPDGQPATTLFTLGYDPNKQHFVGTFVASMMSFLWVYERGTLDAAEKVLTFEATGPSFAVPGGMAKYNDVIELLPDGRRTLSSYHIADDGTRTWFMTATYTRVK